MKLDNPFQGQLFADGFLCGSIVETEDWQSVDDGALESLRADLRALFDRFPADRAPNEPQTETDLIHPVLERLGWEASLWQQRLSTRGRTHVPDGLLFADQATKARANRLPEQDRYRLGLAIVESKRWGRPLDRRSAGDGAEAAPATQMLSYLGRADVMTEGGLRWGVIMRLRPVRQAPCQYGETRRRGARCEKASEGPPGQRAPRGTGSVAHWR